jgi:subtilisin-like proprotein convertase family protein
MDLEASIESTLISILNPDGTPDLWMDGPAGNAFGAKVDSQGRIIYFGQVDAPDGHDFLAMRLFDDLTLDPSFGVPAPPPSGITVTPTSGLMTTEDGGSDTFTVVLDSQPTADVTIAISSGDSSEGVLVGADELGFVALAFDQYNWSQPQTVTVTGVDDSDPDGDVAYTVVLGAATSADPAYNGLNAADVSLTNLDNEGQSNVFASEDVPKTIADPHPVKGVKPVTSQLVIASTGITVDLIDVDLMIAHASMSDLTVTLKSPGNTTADLFYDGADWYLAEPAAFKDESLDGTWVLAVTDNQRNGITGTLTAWSIAPLTQGAASQGETLSVADLYFLDLGLNSKKDSHKSNPLASQAADELALMLVE